LIVKKLINLFVTNLKRMTGLKIGLNFSY